MSKSPLFYAKILLFGEYGIIKDAMGLSIPYDFYKGVFKQGDIPSLDDDAQRSNRDMRAFLDYLRRLEKKDRHLRLDLDRLENDLDGGLYFDSSIPQGFGVGSSGALCAAVYDRYAIDKIDADNTDKKEIVRLKEIFSEMESFFHGKSSGIDPLICYLNLPLLIRSTEDLGTVAIPESRSGKGAIFLLNSGKPGQTQPMVNLFFEKMKQDGFRRMLKEQFNKHNDECIQAFLKGDIKPLFHNLKALSSLLLDNFHQMIPVDFHPIWKKGIDTNAYYLKLCGSGGGGFVLGFTRDYKKAEKLLKPYEPEVIYRF